MSDGLITLWRYRDLPEALLAKGKLEASGIECFLADDNYVRLDWFISNAIGGIRLQVPAKDADAAKEILESGIPSVVIDESTGEQYRQPECPKCHSLDVFEFPDLFRCGECGHEWNEELSS